MVRLPIALAVFSSYFVFRTGLIENRPYRELVRSTNRLPLVFAPLTVDGQRIPLLPLCFATSAVPGTAGGGRFPECTAMTIPSTAIRTGRRTLIRQFSTGSAALAVILTAATFPASAVPSSTAPPPNSSGTSAPPTGITTGKVSPTTDGGTGDGYQLIFDVPSTAVQGTTIPLRGKNWLCSKVTVAPGWTTATTTVTFPSYQFETTVTVPANATPGKTTVTATCTADSSISSTRSITVLAARKPTTDRTGTGTGIGTDIDEVDAIPPTATAQASENTSEATLSGPLAVTGALILAAVVGTVILFGRGRPATRTSAPSSNPTPAPFRRRKTGSAHAADPASRPRHPGRAPDVQIRAHPDPNPRLDIRTPRLPEVRIRLHRSDPVTTVREVRR